MYICTCGHPYLVLCVDLHAFPGKGMNLCEYDEFVRIGCVDHYDFTWCNLRVLQNNLSEIYAYICTGMCTQFVFN